MRVKNILLWYRKRGYKIYDSKVMGTLTGLSPNNCKYQDIREVITPNGEKIFVTDASKIVILTKRFNQSTFNPYKLIKK